jgi:DNA repair exonuclease SbcCD ATPase subunit
MNLLRLLVNNFMSIGTIELIIEPGLTLITGVNSDNGTETSSNGAGKSALMDSIPWCLYGISPRGTPKDSIVRRDSDGTMVRLSILHFNELIEITRYRKHPQHNNSVYVTVDGQDKTLKSTKLTDEYISRLLCTSYEMFINTSFLSQGFQNRFSRLTSMERQKLLESLVHTEVYENASKASRVASKSISQDASSKETELSSILSTLEGMSSIENSISSDIRKLTENTDTEDALKKSLSSIPLSGFQEETAKFQKALSDVETSRHTLQLEREQTSSSRNLISSEISRLRKDLDEIKSMKSCPTCKQQVPSEHRTSIIHSITTALSPKEKELDSILSSIKQLDAKLARCSSLEAEFSSKLESSQSSLQKSSSEYHDINSRISLLHGTASSLSSLKQRLEDIHSQATSLRDRYISVKDSISSLSSEQDIVSFWIAGFQDLRKRTLSSTVSYLNDRIAFYSKFFWERQVLFSISDSELSLTIDGNDLLSASGGEAKRVDLAVAFAIRDLYLSCNSTSPSLLVIDEPCDFLDESGSKALVSLLSNTDLASSIFLISHNPVIKSLIPNSITISKENSISRKI